MTNKLFIIAFIIQIFICTNLFCQQNYQDVVYLKNGSIIHGTILEQVIGKSIKIETADGNIFVYIYDEIDKITKEPIKDNPIKLSNGSPSYNDHKLGKKSPALAFVLSFIICPGTGQIYNGEPGKGISQILLVGIGIAGAIAGANNDQPGLAAGGLALASVVEIWSIIDAPVSASRINAERGYSHVKFQKHISPTVSFGSAEIRKNKLNPRLNMTYYF
jgi:hypothetical protein